jgi:hypothetical protein
VIPILALIALIYIGIEKQRQRNEQQPLFVWGKYVEIHEVSVKECKSDDGMQAPPDINVDSTFDPQ